MLVQWCCFYQTARPVDSCIIKKWDSEFSLPLRTRWTPQQGFRRLHIQDLEEAKPCQSCEGSGAERLGELSPHAGAAGLLCQRDAAGNDRGAGICCCPSVLCQAGARCRDSPHLPPLSLSPSPPLPLLAASSHRTDTPPVTHSIRPLPWRRLALLTGGL